MEGGREGGREAGREGGRYTGYTYSNRYVLSLSPRHVARNYVSRRSIVPRRLPAEQGYVITFDVTWTP